MRIKYFFSIIFIAIFIITEINGNDNYDYDRRHRGTPEERLNRKCEYWKRYNRKLYNRECRKVIETTETTETTETIGTIEIKHEKCRTIEGLEGKCQPPAYCYSQYNGLEDYNANRCKFSNGAMGICCPKQERSPSSSYELPIRIPRQYSPSGRIRHITLEEINEAARKSLKVIEEFLTKEQYIVSKGMVQRSNSKEAFHQSFFGGFDKTQFTLTKGGLINLITTIKIKEKFKLTKEEARDGLLKYSIKNTDLQHTCIEEPICRQSKYRTADGSCNNLQHPLWGRSNTAFSRIVPPAYADGLNELRVSIDGSPLPGPREVSLVAATDRNIPDRKFSLFVFQWGQFIDHDLTLASSTRAASGEGIMCCEEHEDSRRKQRLNPHKDSRLMHPACIPIPIPEDDPFYSQFSQTCINFVRNAAAPRMGCTLGHREQMNTLTHYIDGSMVYGSDTERSNHLRSFKNGLLRISIVNKREFLPFDTQNKSDECGIPEPTRLQCFVGGDVRVNEQTGLTMLHNLLLREHNRVARELLKINPHWNDETLYQEARRIVGAEIQHITYNEWTPLILGRTVMTAFNLLPKTYGFVHDYDPNINPGIINAFATAAYRLHTLIQGIFQLRKNDGTNTENLQLRDLFNNPTSIYRKGAYDEYLNGFSFEPTQTFDQFFTEDITNHLFQEHGTLFGMDLISLNLQRGREHGIPGYNVFRKACGLNPIESFEELESVLRKGSAKAFKSVYKHVDDIDLFVAGNHEKELPDAVVGPTFACILGEQSRRGKLGDRFWYENGQLPHSFTENQLYEIRKSSLARLVCDNGYEIDNIQPLAFLQPIGRNLRIPCNEIAKVNLEHWRGERIWRFPTE